MANGFLKIDLLLPWTSGSYESVIPYQSIGSNHFPSERGGFKKKSALRSSAR
jgi:hypothetical protein